MFIDFCKYKHNLPNWIYKFCQGNKGKWINNVLLTKFIKFFSAHPTVKMSDDLRKRNIASENVSKFVFNIKYVFNIMLQKKYLLNNLYNVLFSVNIWKSLGNNTENFVPNLLNSWSINNFYKLIYALKQHFAIYFIFI